MNVSLKPDLAGLPTPHTTPFTIELADATPLNCTEVVRSVSGRRQVCRGYWNDQPVYAKLFIGKQAKRYARRDQRGAKMLADAGMDTPALLYAGAAADGQTEVLLFREVAGSVNAEQAWQLATQAQRLDLARSLVAEVAAHHKAGLLQADLYLKNFLLQGDRIYTLDGDAVRKLSPILCRRQQLQNLALLLSKFDVSDEAQWLPDLLAVYARQRGCEPLDIAYMQRLVAAHRHRVASGYADKKVFRSCTDVAVRKSWCKFMAVMNNEAGDALRPALEDLDVLLDDTRNVRLKSGNTCTVSLTEVGDRKVVVKRYNIKSPLHALSRMWRPSRAAISWANAHRLRMYGIATAAPLALLERRCGPLRLQAYFVAAFVDAPDIGACLQDASVTAEQKQALVSNLAALLYKLRLLQIAHGDLKMSNIHVQDTAPILIDLDSLRQYHCKRIFEYRHVRDLQRLLRNWQHEPLSRQMVADALHQRYGNDPLLKRAGI